MGVPLREALRRLCLEFGWSYAVFWRVTGFGSPMHLIWEDGYCDQNPGMPRSKVSELLLKEQGVIKSTDSFLELGCQADDGLGVLVHKIMASQVHVVGDGLVGHAASMGKHQWINQNNLDKFGFVSKGFADMNCQVLAGIQTVVVVPVLPFGVIQLGSTQMVLENIEFVDHVKSLLIKLKCGPRALSSDITQKALQEKSQIYSSPGKLISGCQSTDVCTRVDNIWPITAGGCCSGLTSPPAPKSFTESLSSVSSQLNKKHQSAVREVMSSKQTLKTTDTLGKSPVQSTQDRFCKLDMDRVRQVPPADMGSECQNESSTLNSVLLSDSLKALEEELMLTSALGAIETTNNLPTSLEEAKNSPLNLKSVSSNNSDKFGSVGFLSFGVNGCSNSCANVSAHGIPPVLLQTSYSLRNPGISEVSETDQPFPINKVSHGVSNAGTLKENNDLVEASCILSSGSDTRASCSDLLPEIFQSNLDLVWRDQRCKNVCHEPNVTCPVDNCSNVQYLTEYKPLHTPKNDTLLLPLEFASSCDLFSMLGFGQRTHCSNGSLDDVLEHKDSASSCKLGTHMPKLPTDSDACPVVGSSDQISCSGLFSAADSDQLLDAIVPKVNPKAKQETDDDLSFKASLSKNHSSHYAGSPDHGQVHLSKQSKDGLVGFLPVPVKTEPASSSYGKSSCSFEEVGEYPQNSGLHRSQISARVENIQNVKYEFVSDSDSKKVADLGKLNRKRPRPGESPRPRPKDRQMIQDRIKELREIVPNGSKCSIDALLEKTIKHMLFLQSVTKHGDKLKVTGEPKISNKEGGLLLKDNFDGGATWAFEVGTQPTICPIVVEDLNPPRQMLVEMLCEDRGFFLEIADFIRGLGLTILKGVMEARKNKVWARFAVEANRDMTRMEIFLSLVQLLEPASESVAAPSSAAANINTAPTVFHQTSVPARVV
ncbi:transcription factor LHW isoform X1 [Musa acuminata AAA Group]|uniref:transcription factor LHW isoform X1 n=1 Tax=Musa acuminata AAA Group TaxID=214697 RepID=UPI0031E37D1F